MEAALITLFVALGFVVLPLVAVLHYVTKWKATRGLSENEEKILEDLWRDGQRMEQRLSALEAILESDSPDWRKRL